MTSLPSPPSYPLHPEHEQWAIEQHAAALARVRHLLEKDYGLEQLETRVNEELREGRLTTAIKTAAA